MQGRWLRAALPPLALLKGTVSKKAPVVARCEDDEASREHLAAAVREANGWHFKMLRDADRARKFEAALQKAVKPGDLVLDIGAGTGLLGLMADRAGGTVYACEANRSFAAVARRIVQTNGASFPIFAKSSHRLEVPGDLPKRADVLVGEVLSSSLFGEGILATFRDAHARLVRPGARVIPRRVALSFAVVEWDDFHRGSCAGEVAGFDVSAFNAFRVEHRLLELPPSDSSALRCLTAAQVGLEVDLGDPRDPLLADAGTLVRDFEAPAVAAGQCHLVVVWWDAWLDEEGEVRLSTNPFEELPPFRLGHWGTRGQVLPLGEGGAALAVGVGDVVRVRLTLRQDRSDPQPHFSVSVARRQ